MSTRLKIWLSTTLIYLCFFAFEQFVATMTAAGREPEEIAMVEQFAREDSGRQFLMANNVDYNENPPHVEGAEPGEDADQLMARYMEHMFPALLARASHPAVMGPAVFRAMDLAGIEGNIAFPIEPKLYLGDLRLVLGLFLLALTALIDSTLMSRKLKKMQASKGK
jgi:hypothetical protein